MLTLNTALTFFALSLVLGFTPGPDNIAVLMQSATQGRRAGLFMTLGLCAGLVVHTLAVALGLAALFAASNVAFIVLKFVGATYLAYLAWGAFSAPVNAMSTKTPRACTAIQMFLRGVLMNLTNPKVVFFFLALLPQFVQAEQGAVTLQLCMLGLLFILATLVAFGTMTYFSASFSARLKQSTQAQQWLNYFAGSVFLGLAARLAVSEK